MYVASAVGVGPKCRLMFQLVTGKANPLAVLLSKRRFATITNGRLLSHALWDSLLVNSLISQAIFLASCRTCCVAVLIHTLPEAVSLEY